jgi:crotonobetainyl-CoA:carnitine CoA-transferase CaiB-like acyl-CoA transferase
MADFSRFLDGITVLDLSQYLPGPMATLFLADMGARVIKVEPPQGDPMQDAGPRDRQGRPVFYHTVNGGKTVVRLNLKSDPDRERFFVLLEDADVVVEGFRPGVLDRLGIGYPTLQARKPDVILCSISGYGAGTEYASTAGHDGNYLAISGAMARNGDGAAFYDPPVADGAGALFAAMAILGALHGRDRGQGGCHIDLWPDMAPPASCPGAKPPISMAAPLITEPTPHATTI